jgi:hypothetical protein
VPNLFFAGRNLSATHVAFASTRVMATCALVGQAVGTAAAVLASGEGNDIAALATPEAIEKIQQQLLKDDVFLPGHRNSDPTDLAPQAKILKANILTGLTIRRYESFHSCPSYAKITANEHQQKLQAAGIHILFKQADDGSIILGDSHEYAPVHKQSKFGFEISTEINDMMLNEAKKILHLADWTVDSSWAGFYLQSTVGDVFTKSVDNVIHIINGIGGKGMTTSPGFTEEYIQKLYE